MALTRDEQIINAAKDFEKSTGFGDIVLKAKGVNSAYGIGFLEGAKWADWHPNAMHAWEIYNFINKYKNGAFGAIPLQDAFDKYWLEETAAFFEPDTK